MNPYKKINDLEQKVMKLKKENDNLRFLNKESERIKIECETKITLAENKELEYCRLIDELREEKQLYQKLIHQLKFAGRKIKANYKKAFNDIKKDIRI